MCCKNRPLAVFGACLAITAASASALISSHADDADQTVPQVAPQADEHQAEPKPVLAPADKPPGKTADEQKAAHRATT